MFEVILSSIIIVSITTFILLYLFHRRVIWWEIVGLLVISIIVSLLFRWVLVSDLTKDYEYWGTRFEKVEYYEEWDEYINKTCTETYSCGTADKPQTCTRTYDCSYIQNHPERWIKIDNIGYTYNTTKEDYDRLLLKMNNSTFHNMKRNYHNIDGNMYYTVWDRDTSNYECITSMHRYINKTQVVKNIYNYPKVETIDINDYQLFSYPPIETHYQRKLLGYNDSLAEHKLQILNGELGHKKQVKVFILIYKNQSIEAGYHQRDLWAGGNKNEFIITINIDNNNKPTWVFPFSWSEKETPKIKIRDYILSQDTLAIIPIIDYTYKQIDKYYERKSFSDFDYLQVELNIFQLFWIILLTTIINIILSIYIILNRFE